MYVRFGKKNIIPKPITQLFKWVKLVGLLEVAALFAAASCAGYFAIHELKEKDVKKIQKRRLQNVRRHLSNLAKKCVASKKVTEKLEDEFQGIFEKEYNNAYEPTRILGFIDRSFLFSMILFFVTVLLD